MATIIEAVATSHPGLPFFGKGARRLADEAARRCLSQSGRTAEDIDLLINAGIYREDDLAEPALASMIQQDIDANPGHPLVPEHHGTFSFDITSGGSGVLTAFELLDGFLKSRTISVGMVVTSDVPPRHAVGFPFTQSGAAAIVRSTDGPRGFVDFAFETFPEIEESFRSVIAWHATEHHVPMLAPGHNELEVHETQEFARAALDCAVHVIRGFLERNRLSSEDLDLVLTSQYPDGFSSALADRLRISGDRIGRSPIPGTHTAGPLFALEEATQSGRLLTAKNVLFVTVGAGVTIGAALYRP